jgi:hypothetical protein
VDNDVTDDDSALWCELLPTLQINILSTFYVHKSTLDLAILNLFSPKENVYSASYKQPISQGSVTSSLMNDFADFTFQRHIEAITTISMWKIVSILLVILSNFPRNMLLHPRVQFET